MMPSEQNAGETARTRLTYESFRDMPWTEKIDLLLYKPGRRINKAGIRSVADGLAVDWSTCAFGQQIDRLVPGWRRMNPEEDSSRAVSAIETVMPRVVSLGVMFGDRILRRDYCGAEAVAAEIDSTCHANAAKIRGAVLAAAEGRMPVPDAEPATAPKHLCKFCHSDLHAYPYDRNYAHKECNTRWDRLTQSGLCGKCGEPFEGQEEAGMGMHHRCYPDGVPYSGYSSGVGGASKKAYMRRCGMTTY